MKGISDLSSALMEYELYRDHSLQSQATTDSLSASESSFGTVEHACPNGVTSPGAPSCGMCVCVCVTEQMNETLKRRNNPVWIWSP